MDKNEDPIVVEQDFNVPRSVVWKAITDKDQMPQWFFEQIEDFEPEPGFETQFNVQGEDRDYLHLWKVTEVAPESRIVYGWRYDGIPGDSRVVWELSETPEGTRLNFSHEICESFPADNPVFSREAGEHGWDYFIRQRLKEYLEPQSE